MWTILTYKKNELNILLKNLRIKLSNNVTFYQPKVKISLYKNNKLINKSRPLLNNYLFCFSSNFNSSHNLNNIINTRGLKSLVGDCSNSQKEITDFINFCKDMEDNDGHIKQSMFLDIVKDRYYKFTSGPFANLIFKLLEKNKKNLRILIGKVTTTINIKNNYNFQLV